ncbi:MAG: helix-turn-helix domain-containing protein [Erysipelothrix sp.]|nr:helix-turn-helix domain-containing protein [Erysipelothrix sp.]
MMNDKLIKLRRKLGLSQEEFGQLIGVSRQAVLKW